MTASHGIQMELSNGSTMLVSAIDAQGESLSVEGVPSFREVVKVIEGIGEDLKSAIETVAPQKATVEFGVELAVKEGVLFGLLARTSGTASLTVTLEWGT